MTLEVLLQYITTDKIALLFFFMLLPVLTFALAAISSGRSLERPFSYIFACLIFAGTLPGFLSLTLWLYSMIFEEKSLLQLPFFVYYMPIIVMFLCLSIIKKRKISISKLPWSGELYELMILIVISFAMTLILMHFSILNFKSLLHLGLFFTFWLIVIRFGWTRFKKLLSPSLE